MAVTEQRALFNPQIESLAEQYAKSMGNWHNNHLQVQILLQWRLKLHRKQRYNNKLHN